MVKYRFFFSGTSVGAIEPMEIISLQLQDVVRRHCPWVYVGLTGDTSMNPYAVAQMAQEDGFYVNGSGSSWSMMTELATKLGLSAQELSLNEDSIRQELSQGHPIICIMGPGDFTTSGHFVVLTGVDSEGKITVNDSNSKKNSNKAWKIEDLMSQIRDLWVYQ